MGSPRRTERPNDDEQERERTFQWVEILPEMRSRMFRTRRLQRRDVEGQNRVRLQSLPIGISCSGFYAVHRISSEVETGADSNIRIGVSEHSATKKGTALTARRTKFIKESGPYKVYSNPNATLVIVPAWLNFQAYDEDDGGGPGFPSRMRLAREIEEFLNVGQKEES